MKFKEWWGNLLSKFGGKEDPDTEPVVELVPAEAPEPVPDRKTSDEMIVEMADSTLKNAESRAAATVTESEDVRVADRAPGTGEEKKEEHTSGTGEEEIEDPAPVFEEDLTAASVPELDDWTEEAVPEYEDETDGIREE